MVSNKPLDGWPVSLKPEWYHAGETQEGNDDNRISLYISTGACSWWACDMKVASAAATKANTYIGKKQMSALLLQLLLLPHNKHLKGLQKHIKGTCCSYGKNANIDKNKRLHSRYCRSCYKQLKGLQKHFKGTRRLRKVNWMTSNASSKYGLPCLLYFDDIML